MLFAGCIETTASQKTLSLIQRGGLDTPSAAASGYSTTGNLQTTQLRIKDAIQHKTQHRERETRQH